MGTHQRDQLLGREVIGKCPANVSLRQLFCRLRGLGDKREFLLGFPEGCAPA
jgi:hypothetical protein